ncbi:MAG: glycoside hydrolase family 30 beta sandwich domain-containing protein [Rariglobus sp.]
MLPRPFLRFARTLIIGQLVLLPAAWGASVTWISSTAEQPWQTMPAPSLAPGNADVPPQVRVAPTKTYQTISGFGGCFNELGWVALNKASAADRAQVISSLFADDGCAFTLARLPIGASDFALDGYSLADTPGDLELKSFSVARDEQHLIPFVKAAMAVRPSLQCWGSPWSPPAWMKTTNSYSKGSLKWEPAILRSYATYLARWVETYRGLGFNIYALSPQNEPNILNVYPTTLWSGPQLREFIADYLGPTLRDRKTNVELWLGLNGDPLNTGDNINDRLVTVLEDPKANAFITGVAYQYDSRNQIAVASRLYPEKQFIQSETECNKGDNSWADAQRLYTLMKRYIDGGAGSYFAWNMVLDETGMSTWKWKQNALITVNRETGKVTYNGEYYVMRHFSHYVKPGAKRVLSTGLWGDQIAFVNPDGSTVIVLGNSDKQPQSVTLAVSGRAGGDTLKATLPSRSINTFVISP